MYKSPGSDVLSALLEAHSCGQIIVSPPSTIGDSRWNLSVPNKRLQTIKLSPAETLVTTALLVQVRRRY